MANEYAELYTTSNFSFLQGGSHPEEYVRTAAELGYTALAITDRLTLGGVVRAHGEAMRCGIQLIVGAKIPMAHSIPVELLLYPRTPKGYGILSSFITEFHCAGTLPTLGSLSNFGEEGVVVLPMSQQLYAATSHNPDEAQALLELLRSNLPPTALLSIGTSHGSRVFDTRLITYALNLCKLTGIPPVVTGDVLYHTPARKPLQDILTCIREKRTISNAGYLLESNAERHLRNVEDIWHRFRNHPGAIIRTTEIAEALKGFSLQQLTYEYPAAECPAAVPPVVHLRSVVYERAGGRFPNGIPAEVIKLIEMELSIIEELHYEKYFLTCYDIVRFAQARGILHQGRGAAANSAVCYCLGITAVDPTKIDLLFGRFISRERNEPPDIDIDFEHERREEVMQYLFEKYGRSHAALTAEIVSYRHRSALRDVGKALDLAPEVIDTLAKKLHRWTGSTLTEEIFLELGISSGDHIIQLLLRLTKELYGFPRHRSQHVGGFIISSQPLTNLVPIVPATMLGRTIIEWDKDDIETLGILKIDILALGMLTCIRKAFTLISPNLEIANIPREVPEVYDMLCEGDSVGVFQVESRAQISMLPRLQPREFYDLIIQVAIVRPGPIQGDMVHPYLRRRAGKEVPHYPDEKVRAILGKTLGVPLFQEQAMRLAIALANFSPGEAELLRRAMATWKRNEGEIAHLKARVVQGMIGNGYTESFAEACMNQIKGFAEYGFPESHAASFANLVYVSAWLKRFYPAQFTTALLNSQPMGFYAPAQLIADAKRHNIKVLPIDICHSEWDTTLVHTQAENPAMRLGFHLVSGLRQRICEAIIQARGGAKDFRDLWRSLLRANPTEPQLLVSSFNALARADAFQSFNMHPREALWEISSLPTSAPSLALRDKEPKSTYINPLSRSDSLFMQYRTVGFSLTDHPLSILRPRLAARGAQTATILSDPEAIPNYSSGILSAGLVTIRQRPGTAKGVLFITMEDETGLINLVVRPHLFDQWRHILMDAKIIAARGKLQRTGCIPYICVDKLWGLDHLLN